MKYGADIIKEERYRKAILFIACKNGNETLVKYLVGHGEDI